MNIKILFDTTVKDVICVIPPNELDFSKPKTFVKKTVLDVLYCKFGDKSRLFCESCFKNEDVYRDENDCDSINNNDELDDFEDFDENEEEDDDENAEYNDPYYIRRGKYDMY
jgi:hypothetical protein